MYFNDPGTVSEGGTLIVASFVLLANLLPSLQIVLYSLGILTALGTLLINRKKYLEELKKLYKSIKDAFKKTDRRSS